MKIRPLPKEADGWKDEPDEPDVNIYSFPFDPLISADELDYNHINTIVTKDKRL